VKRGEIWWASLGEPFGSAPGLRRPVLVVQSDEFNASAIQTVIVAAMTSNARLARAPGNLLCSRRQTGLKKPSVVNVSQITAVDRRRLFERTGVLTPDSMAKVDEGLRLVLSLGARTHSPS
jgi:mRNA interferase MazF